MLETTNHRVRRRSALATALCVLGLLGLADPAASAFSPKKGIWGPVRVDGVSQFPIYQDLGAGIYMTGLNWSSTAPTEPAKARDPADPAYVWPIELDDAITEAAANGMRVAVVVSRSPRWASGKESEIWAPERPADYGRFLAAASKRYPSVRLWQIWGEPTQQANFQPLIHENRDPAQNPSVVRPLTRKMKRGPHRYARMVNAAYRELKRVSPQNLVIGGSTFTTGDVSPLNWIRNLRLPNGRPPRMDLYGHNPFSARRPAFGGPALGYGFADFNDLPRLAKWIDRHLGRKRRSNRGIKIFISEMLWPTDHSNFEFNFWVSQETAASWLRDALRLTRGWNRIYSFSWYALYDDRPRPDGQEVNRGLMTLDGEKKPAYRAFKRG